MNNIEAGGNINEKRLDDSGQSQPISENRIQELGNKFDLDKSKKEQEDRETEKYFLKTYEDFRKEILGFKDLPDSTFVNRRNMTSPLTPEEAKNATAHSIKNRIEEFYHDYTQKPSTERQQFYSLIHLFEKEIQGRETKRVMYDLAGNVIDEEVIS